MGRSILLTRTSDGSVKAFDNVCLHRQSQVVSGCGIAKRFTCPYHAWTYDNTGRLVALPGREGFPDDDVEVRRVDRAAGHRIRRISVDSAWIPVRPWMSRHTWGRWPRNSTHGASDDGPRWARRCSTPPSTGSWRSTRSPRTTTSPPCTSRLSRPSPAATARCSTAYGPHHRLIFPLNTILDLDNDSEDQWDPVQQHGRHLRAVPQHRAFGDDRQRRVVPRLPRRRAGQVHYRPPEFDSAGPVRRIDGRRVHKPSSSTRTPPCATRTTDWWRDCRPTSNPVPANSCCSDAMNPDCSIATSPGQQALKDEPGEALSVS